MSDILIPAKYLKEGFNKEAKHIESLLEDSQILFNAKKYPSSLSLSILAHEEIAKLKTIRDKNFKNEGISKKEWSDLIKGGSHKSKLTKPSEERKKNLEKMGEKQYEIARKFREKTGDPLSYQSYSEAKKGIEGYEIMGNLDKIKQDCFYLNWENSKWSSAKIKLSKQELLSVAHVILEITKWYLNQTVLLSKHEHIDTDETSTSYQNFIKDPRFKKGHEFKKQFQTTKFKKQTKLVLKLLKTYC